MNGPLTASMQVFVRCNPRPTLGYMHNMSHLWCPETGSKAIPPSGLKRVTLSGTELREPEPGSVVGRSARSRRGEQANGLPTMLKGSVW
jgi:hypothetical protein